MTIRQNRGTGKAVTLLAGEIAVDLTADAAIIACGDTNGVTTYAAQYIPSTTGLTFIHAADVDVTLLTLPNITETPLVFWDESLNAFAFSPGLVVGDGTNYAAFGADGDLKFVGTAGLLFGEISAHDLEATIAISGTGVGNKVQITTFDTNGPSNGMTPDHTNDHITVDTAGHYLLTVSIALESTGAGSAALVGIAAYKNNGVTSFDNCHAHRRLSGGGTDEGSASISGIVDLDVNDTVEVWFWNETNTNDLVVDDITLSLVQIGGT